MFNVPSFGGESISSPLMMTFHVMSMSVYFMKNLNEDILELYINDVERQLDI